MKIVLYLLEFRPDPSGGSRQPELERVKYFTAPLELGSNPRSRRRLCGRLEHEVVEATEERRGVVPGMPKAGTPSD